jgi:GTP-binding protein HflX
VVICLRSRRSFAILVLMRRRSVSIAGYTNAGKSSLLNRLTDAGVLVEDALFATLDPTTRRTAAEDGRVFTLSDTVGFVRHLPHHIVEAFRSTLEEVAYSDLIVHVVDGAHPDPEGQVAAVREVLGEVGADRIPELLVVNKMDAADEETILRLKRAWPDAVFVSARSGLGIEELHAAIAQRLPRPSVTMRVLLPYDRGDLVARIHRTGQVLETRHTEQGTELRVRVGEQLAADLENFLAP